MGSRGWIGRDLENNKILIAKLQNRLTRRHGLTGVFWGIRVSNIIVFFSRHRTRMEVLGICMCCPYCLLSYNSYGFIVTLLYMV